MAKMRTVFHALVTALARHDIEAVSTVAATSGVAINQFAVEFDAYSTSKQLIFRVHYADVYYCFAAVCLSVVEADMTINPYYLQLRTLYTDPSLFLFRKNVPIHSNLSNSVKAELNKLRLYTADVVRKWLNSPYEKEHVNASDSE